MWLIHINTGYYTGCQGSNTIEAYSLLHIASYQRGAALTGGWILFLALEPWEYRAGERGSLWCAIIFLLRAPPSGYGWGQRCNMEGVHQQQSVLKSSVRSYSWWEGKQLAQTQDLIRFLSKHGARRLYRPSPLLLIASVFISLDSLYNMNQTEVSTE